ncbi:HNH endonuclease [Vibrio sp. T11.5]|uniref:HNH endonuclease n=1 Tax=Vibrio sp. T11.5 TaxID=2998836 RepID=UPI0022CD4791|nr:HNH endonuclease [Vibrio sp. T11.5]MDA0116878.1 HNH endonuclease [Vibrio sp. T11.5]
MKLNVDLSEFNKLVDENVSERLSQFSVSLDSPNFDRMDELSKAPHLVTDFDLDISINGQLLSYDGHGVIVYIKEHSDLSKAVADPYNEAKRYHMTDCKTIQDEKKDKRFGRLVALRYTEGGIPICDDKGITEDAKLVVCGRCLRKLKYPPYLDAGDNDDKKRVQLDFNLREFLKKQHNFPEESLPLRHAEFSNFSYTSDWKSVSEVYKLSKNYSCEECGVELKQRKELLHTHHIDGVKSNNHPANLRALCVECHSMQPKHQHLKPNAEVLSYLKEKRMV